MSSTDYQAMYFRFFQDCVDRNAEAYRRASGGAYSFDEWFRDWAQHAAASTRICYAPIGEILNPNYERVFDAKQKNPWTGVFPYTTTPGTLKVPTFFIDSSGKSKIPCKVEPDALSRYLVVAVPNVTGKPGIVHEAEVWDGATRNRLIFRMNITK